MEKVRHQINPIDGIVLAIFLAFSLLYFWGRLQPNFPLTILTGDGGNLASYAAAQDHPDLFRGDPALGEANSTGYYATIHIPIIRALSRLTGGNYALAFLLTLAPTIWIQLTGFYLLGRALFQNRFYAFLLAVVTAMPFGWEGLGEFWGIWPDPLPRMTFQALLPYLLTLVIRWRRQPRRWPWLMILAGLLVYVHAISAPAIGLAIWLGLWLYLPTGWKAIRKLGMMLGLGLLFLLALSPFVIHFLSYQGQGAPPDFDLVMQVIRTYQPPYLLNAPAALSLFATQTVFELLLPVAGVGFYLVWRFGRVERALVVMVLTWFSAILLASAGIPTLERLVETALHRLPVDTELARGLRYLVPLMLIFWLWPLAEVARIYHRRGLVRGSALLGLILAAAWTGTHPPEAGRMLQALTCLPQGKWVCGNDAEFNQLVAALKQTKPGTRIFFFTDSHQGVPLTSIVRYMAFRPLVYSEMDNSLYLFTHNDYLEQWLKITRRVEQIQQIPAAGERLVSLLPLAGELHTGCLVLDFPISGADLAAFPVEIAMQNRSFTLLCLEKQ